jgi:hypothetical protein
MAASPRFSAEVRKRAADGVWAPRAHTLKWSAIVSIPAKIACTVQTLSSWALRTERDRCQRSGTTTVTKVVAASIG